MTITNDNKIIAKNAFEIFGGKPSVSRYWDENEVSSIDIFEATDRPYENISTYSTIGLSDYSIGLSVDEIPLRIEIVGASYSTFEFYPNIISTCAFNIINTNLSIYHGTIFNDVVKMYYTRSEMEHILFMQPFLWDKHKVMNFPDKKVVWLLAVPISTKELLLAEKEGSEALEHLFVQKEINIFDITRNSVI